MTVLDKSGKRWVIEMLTRTKLAPQKRRQALILAISYCTIWTLLFHFALRPVRHALTTIPMIRRALAWDSHSQTMVVLLFTQDAVLLGCAFVAALLPLVIIRHGSLLRAIADLPALSLLGDRRRIAGWMLVGSVIGVLTVSVIVLALVFIGGAEIDRTRAPLIETVLAFAVRDTIVAVSEEISFRGFALRAFWEAVGFWPAATVTSILFGILHLYGGDPPIGAAATSLIALLFCVFVRLTGSLWTSIGIHLGWDWAQDALYGVNDSGQAAHSALLSTHPIGRVWLSGGDIGPEGSPVCWIVVVALIAVALRFSPWVPSGNGR